MILRGRLANNRMAEIKFEALRKLLETIPYGEWDQYHNGMGDGYRYSFPFLSVRLVDSMGPSVTVYTSKGDKIVSFSHFQESTLAEFYHNIIKNIRLEHERMKQENVARLEEILKTYE